MTSQHDKKVNRKQRNVTKSAYIQYRLKLKGMNLKAIAEELNISLVAVSRAVSDLSKIKRVDEWLKNNLELEYQ
jgi:DNA-directed RNA polymerase specialized sigma subunit